jgi:hypothetical protein
MQEIRDNSYRQYDLRGPVTVGALRQVLANPDIPDTSVVYTYQKRGGETSRVKVFPQEVE